MNLYKFLEPFDYDQNLEIIFDCYSKEITKEALFDKMNKCAIQMFTVDTAWTYRMRLCIFLDNPYDDEHTKEILGMLEYCLGDMYD